MLWEGGWEGIQRDVGQKETAWILSWSPLDVYSCLFVRVKLRILRVLKTGMDAVMEHHILRLAPPPLCLEALNPQPSSCSPCKLHSYIGHVYQNQTSQWISQFSTYFTNFVTHTGCTFGYSKLFPRYTGSQSTSWVSHRSWHIQNFFTTLDNNYKTPHIHHRISNSLYCVR